MMMTPSDPSSQTGDPAIDGWNDACYYLFTVDVGDDLYWGGPATPGYVDLGYSDCTGANPNERSGTAVPVPTDRVPGGRRSQGSA
jgi:hypothetical protein